MDEGIINYTQRLRKWGVVQSEVNKLMQLLQRNPVINPNTWAKGYLFVWAYVCVTCIYHIISEIRCFHYSWKRSAGGYGSLNYSSVAFLAFTISVQSHPLYIFYSGRLSCWHQQSIVKIQTELSLVYWSICALLLVRLCVCLSFLFLHNWWVFLSLLVCLSFLFLHSWSFQLQFF